MLESTQTFYGQYCPRNIEATFNSLPHHCVSMCLQAPNCAAYNYNTTDSTCTSLTTPCPLLQGDVIMEFGVLTTKSSQDCCEWIPFTPVDPTNERMVAHEINPDRTIARTKIGDANYFGYQIATSGVCYVATNTERIVRHRCQRLRIAEGCTVFWAPYTVGDHLPAKVVIVGKMQMAMTLTWQWFTPNFVSTQNVLPMGLRLLMRKECTVHETWCC